MKEIKSVRVWQWLAGLLVLCNFALLATLWFRPCARPMPPLQGGGGPREMVIHNLNLSEEQVRKYDALITDHRAEMDRLKTEGRVLREQFFDNIKTQNKTVACQDSLADVIAQNQKQIEIVTYKHFEQVRQLCTAEQVSEFDRTLNDVLQMMNRPGHNGPPPGNR